MNNDFNFKPKQQPVAKTNTPSVPTAPQTSPDNAPDDLSEPAQEVSPVVVSKRSPGKIRKFFGVLGLLVLVGLVAGAVYFWQQSQIKSLESSKAGLESEVVTLKSQVAEKDKKATAASVPAPGGPTQGAGPYILTQGVTNVITVSPTLVGINEADVSVQYTAKAKEVWVESGTAPDKLTTVSKHVLVTTETDTQAFKLTGLTPGTRYYYRAAGIADGVSVQAGITSFTTKK